ncbi:MAG: Rid family hydrolase [Patescibacteria group bacterium]
MDLEVWQMNIGFLPVCWRPIGGPPHPRITAEIPYSPGYSGTVIFETSGIIKPLAGDLEAQIRAALRQAYDDVVAAGYSMSTVVRVKAYLVGMNAETTTLFNRLYFEFLESVGEQFNLDNGVVYPTRKALGVAALPHDDALFEVVFKVGRVDSMVY